MKTNKSYFAFISFHVLTAALQGFDRKLWTRRHRDADRRALGVRLTFGVSRIGGSRFAGYSGHRPQERRCRPRAKGRPRILRATEIAAVANQRPGRCGSRPLVGLSLPNALRRRSRRDPEPRGQFPDAAPNPR